LATGFFTKRILVYLSFSICLFFTSPAISVDISVSTVSQLANAVSNANTSGGNTTILLHDGTYTLSATLYINSSNVTVASVSGNRENVVIQGDSMSGSAKVGNIFRVAGSNFSIRDVTLQKCGWHTIQIAGESNTDSPTVRNCVLRDAYEQLLKISVDLADTSVSADNGIVENCLFEYTAGVGPQYYIGGIDAHGSRNWIVRNNTFKSIISPSSSVAEFAIHFWDNSANNTVENNLILNCDRGIGFGMDGRGNTAGTIRNNMIYHAIGKGSFADVGISLMESPNTQVYNNTVFMENDFPYSIEYRFTSTTNVLIANNLTNKPIANRNGASGTAVKNVTNAVAAWFVNPSVGDLHLATPQSAVVDAGQLITGLTSDFDVQPRPAGSGIDIGADEYSASAAPKTPRNLRMLD
jgi:hypothetical protein